MKAFTWWWFATGAIAIFSTALFGHAAEKPNFILCMADDQGWGDVGYNGHPVLKTPTLDEMAATGLRFDRFYAAAPVCSPTRGSVLTGRHPNRFGCFSWGYTLRPQEITIAEALQKAGYITGHFGKWHLGSVRADSPVSPGNSGFLEWFSSPNFYENNPLMSHNGRVVHTDGESSQVTVEVALNFIRRARDTNSPFLAVIWFGSPHSPHQGAEENLALYEDQPERKRHYYAEITGIDRAMAYLRAELRQLGLADNTFVWYTSDNGPQAPETHPGSAGHFRGRKGSLWEGGIRVPTIIEWPAVIDKPRTTDILSGTVDIYPTLLELAGVTIPDQPPLDGVSLAALLRGQEQKRTKPMGFWVYPAPGQPVRSHDLLLELEKEHKAGQLDPVKSQLPESARLDVRYSRDELPGHAAWMDGNYKLHRIPQKSKGAFRYALYDLAADPSETIDLADSQPDRTSKMREALQQWQHSVIDSLNGNDY